MSKSAKLPGEKEFVCYQNELEKVQRICTDKSYIGQRLAKAKLIDDKYAIITIDKVRAEEEIPSIEGTYLTLMMFLEMTGYQELRNNLKRYKPEIYVRAFIHNLDERTVK